MLITTSTKPAGIDVRIAGAHINRPPPRLTDSIAKALSVNRFKYPAALNQQQGCSSGETAADHRFGGRNLILCAKSCAL